MKRTYKHKKDGSFVKRYIDRDWFYQKYVIERTSYKDFYSKYNMSPVLVNNRRKEFGISRKRIAWNKGTKGVMKPNKTSFKKGQEKPRNAYKFPKGYKHTEEWKEYMSALEKKQFENGRKKLKPMLGKTHSLETRIKISKNRKGKCVGEKHHNWKGGVSSESQKQRDTLEYNEWKLAVYSRDRGICQLCGKRCDNKNIVAHHLKSFNEYPEERFNVNNGITLCRSCHLKIHSRIEKAKRQKKIPSEIFSIEEVNYTTEVISSGETI